MKKISLSILMMFYIFVNYSQTIVSTSQENKNVILEEFTGIHCGYCPQGHAIAKQIQDAHPDDVVLINIHTGSFANPNPGEPDFRTIYGSSLANQSQLTGYPSGTVNRHVFAGKEMTSGGTAMGRGQWESAANIILGKTAYVNVALEAEIDVQTRVLTVHVEAYYTGNSPKNQNMLNVVLLQNNTLGPQAGGGKGNKYVHMHRLVYMITGQWGDEITNTASGSFIDKTYTYTIPDDYKGVKAELSEMEIAAFVAEDHQEIINGSRTYPKFVNFSTQKNAKLKSILVADKVCESELTPKIKIQNNGGDTIKNVKISFNINNGEDSVFLWTGSLPPLQKTEFELKKYKFEFQSTNTVNVQIDSVNNSADEDVSDNSLSINFQKAIEVTNKITLKLTTDDYGNETSWKLYNSSGSVVKSGSGYQSNKTYTDSFSLDLDCYKFVMKDSYGDGGATYKLKDSNGKSIVSSSGNWGNKEETPFGVTEIDATGILNIENKSFKISAYPNPVCDMLTLDFEMEKNANVEINLYDLAGNLIKTQTYGVLPPERQILELPVKDVKTGIYYLTISVGKSISGKKISVIK